MESKGKIALFIMVFFAAACGTETSAERETEGVVDPYGDPPGYSGDPFAGYGPVTTLDLPASGTTLETVHSTGGWSVQIAACATIGSAESLRDLIQASYEEPVFIDQIGSYHKVRVGSFETSEDSAELRNRLRAGGYPDAWSVEREIRP